MGVDRLLSHDAHYAPVIIFLLRINCIMQLLRKKICFFMPKKHAPAGLVQPPGRLFFPRGAVFYCPSSPEAASGRTMISPS